MKVVINTCFGGFGLSEKAILRYAELKGITLYKKASNDYFSASFYISPDFNDESYFSVYDIPRDAIELVQTVEELQQEANGSCSELKVIEIPDGIDWYIEDYDGIEHVAETHRTWS